MIKLMAICGSRVKGGNMEALVDAALAPLQEAPDVQTETVLLSGKRITPCIHCNWCLRKQTKEKPCAHNDDMHQLYFKLLEADAVILASPAHFGRLSGALADFIDRTRGILHGKVYDHPLTNKVGGSMAIAYYRGGGLETTLASMNAFFHIHQMVLATSGEYQIGAGAVTSKNGTGVFESKPRQTVLSDEHGVASAQSLTNRVVELARIIKAGQEALAG